MSNIGGRTFVNIDGKNAKKDGIDIVLSSVYEEPMPKIKDMRKIFKVAGGTDEDFENFFNDHTLKDLLKLSLDIFKDAGLIKKEKDEKNV